MSSNRQFGATALLFVLFGLSTWLDINGVWIELPLIVNRVPEGWTLPSYLTLAVSLSNIGALILVVLKLIFKQRLDERLFIYAEILVGLVSCALIAEYWHKTSYFAGAQRSILFITLVFLLGTLDTTSTITYADYMKRYDAKLLNALYLGESLTSLGPSILASIQGLGGEVICHSNSTHFDYSSPRFSVRIYFWLFVGIISMSLIAFLLLEYSKISRSFRILQVDSLSESLNAYEISIQADPTPLTLVTTTATSMTKEVYGSFLLLTFLSSVILYGILPSIGTYIMLPYSQRAYYISSILLPVLNPFSVLMGYMIGSILRFSFIFILFLVALCATTYVVIVAVLSPCPPLHDTFIGAVVVIVCYLVAQLIFYYIRLVIGNRIRQELKRDSGLFWLGSASQLGSLAGAIPMYLLVNTYNIFKSRNVCQTYC